MAVHACPYLANEVRSKNNPKTANEQMGKFVPHCSRITFNLQFVSRQTYLSTLQTHQIYKNEQSDGIDQMWCIQLLF